MKQKISKINNDAFLITFPGLKQGQPSGCLLDMAMSIIDARDIK
jgi:hypothetical protein